MTSDEVLDKVKAEIREWYWQADKQRLAEDPCVVDAMIDLFIRTIDKYKEENRMTSDKILEQQIENVLNHIITYVEE